MSNSKRIKIGTRDSQLALWQAKTVQTQLEQLGYQTELIPIKSEGDLNLTQPLYEMGITGIFTKALDAAMLTRKIDIAVHSMKDVPTLLPQGIVESAVLERASAQDVLIHKGLDFLESPQGLIATGSLRRKAQWLHRYPTHQITDLRGNVQTRLQKLATHNWDGAIFAQAGLHRLDIHPENVEPLDWMLPAPAQGAMLVVALQDDAFCQAAVASLNHPPTAICVRIEREFLRTLEGGCSAPIAALAEIVDDQIHFQGALFSLDGKRKIAIEKTIPVEQHNGLGRRCAEEVLRQGGSQLMEVIQKTLPK